jgi:ketosteroid isomerase-like protein
MRFTPIALLLLLSCGKDDAPPPDILQTKTMIRELIEKYHAAGDAAASDAGGLDTMKSLLAPDVTMLRGGEEFARGIDQCMDELQKRVATYKGQSRRTFLASVTIEPIGDMAVATYVASVGTLHAPITAVFRRSQGKWYIKHLHENWSSIVKTP